MLRDLREHGAKVVRRIKSIQFGGSDEAVDGSRAVAAGIGRQFIMPEFWHAKSRSRTRFTHSLTRASSFPVNTSTMESPTFLFGVRRERRIYFQVGWPLRKQVP